MDLNLVTAFVSVVEQQSFTSAAKALGLPKSSVSRRVTELEEELGVQLLQSHDAQTGAHRSGSFVLRAGRARAHRAASRRRVGDRHGHRSARHRARDRAGRHRRAGALADVIAEFVAEYPDIHVELSLSSKVADLVGEGFDIGIRAGKSHDSTLVARRLGDSGLGLYASADYLKRRGRPKAPAELAEHDCVLFRGKYGKALWRLDGPNGETSAIEVHGRVTVDDMLFVRQAIGVGLGIGLLPTIAIATCARVGSLDPVERIMPGYSMSGAEVAVVTPSGPKRPRRVTLLRDFLVQRLTPRCENHDILGKT